MVSSRLPWAAPRTTSWQDMQRTAGTYQPGQMPALQDQLSAGSDNL